MGKRWRGLLCQQGIETGDGRMLAAGGGSHRALPLSYRFIFVDSGWGHQGAMTVATLDEIVIPKGNETDVMGGGEFVGDYGPADDAMKLIKAQRGLSIDLTNGTSHIEFLDPDGKVDPDVDFWDYLFDPDYEDYTYREVWDTWEIGAVTGCSTPAFADAAAELVPDSEEVVTAAAALGIVLPRRTGTVLDIYDTDEAPVAASAAPGTLTLLTQGGAIRWAGTVSGFAKMSDLGVGKKVTWVPDGGDEASVTVNAVNSDDNTVTLSVNGTPGAKPDATDDEAGARIREAYSADYTLDGPAFEVQKFLSEIPLSDRGVPYDGLAAKKQVFDDLCAAPTDEDPKAFDPACAFRAFFWRSDSEPNDARGSYKLTYCDVTDGKLRAVWHAITAAAGAVEGARGGASIPEADKAKVRGVIEQWYARARKQYNDETIKVPWGGDEDDDSDEAAARAYPGLSALAEKRRVPLVSLLASSAPGSRSGKGASAVLTAAVSWDDGVPASHFAQRSYDGPFPFTVADDGRVYGHLAPRDQPHAGLLAGTGRRVTIPLPSPTEYRQFYSSKQYRCDDGTRVSVGALTFNNTHAPAGEPGNRPTLSEVMAHYEHTDNIAAWLRCYEDEWGLQCAGILRPGLSIDAVRQVMGSAPSVDLRDYGNGLDLAGVLQVNQPAWPVLRYEDGKPYQLVASMSPRRRMAGGRRPTVVIQEPTEVNDLGTPPPAVRFEGLRSVVERRATAGARS